MKNVQQEELKDVIKSLELMHNIRSDEQFRNRMERKVRALSSNEKFVLPHLVFRTALVTVLILIVGGTSVVAAQDSKPGTLLYPVKKIVDSVKTSFTPDLIVTTEPTIVPQKLSSTPTPEPSPTPVNTQSTTSANDKTTKPVLHPAQTPTATPTQKPQGVLPAAVKPVDHVINNTSVKVDLPIGGIQIGNSAPTPTPTPPPGGSNNEGSKDNGSNAGAGGSLLPKIKIGL